MFRRSLLLTAAALAAFVGPFRARAQDATAGPVPDPAAVAAGAMPTEQAIVREELGALLELEHKARFGSAIGSFVMAAGMIGLGTYFLVDDTEFSENSDTMNTYVGASFIAASAVPLALGVWKLATPSPWEVGLRRMLADPELSPEAGLAMLELAAERDRQMRLAGALGSIVYGGIGLGVGSLFVSEQGLEDKPGWVIIAFSGLSILKGTWGLFCRTHSEKIFARAQGRIASGGLSDVELSPSFGVLPNGGVHGGLGLSGRF